MSDNTLENQSILDENTDNMSQNEAEDALARELNTDDSMPGIKDQLSEDSTDDEIERLEAELKESKDHYLRLVAEFENFRKRNAKERLELIQTAGKDILQSLLVVLDDTDRAEKQVESAKDLAAVKEGISLVFGKMRNIMQQKGLQKMECLNESFNADLHEAITEIPAPSEDMKGKIIDVVEPGYYLNEKLIRHAKVVVGN